MRNYIRGLIALVLLSFGSAVYAMNCSELTIPNVEGAALQTARAACQQAVADAAKAAEGIVPGSVDLSDPNKLSAWGQVAQEWAKALGIAANELGIAVDNFLDTDAGKLTAAVIIWQVAGDRLIGGLVGVPLLIATLWIGLRIARRWRYKHVEYGAPLTWFGLRRTANITYDDSDGATLLSVLTYIVTIVLSVWIVAGVIL